MERCAGEQDREEESLASGIQRQERCRPYMDHALSHVQSLAAWRGIRQDGLHSMTGATGPSAVTKMKWAVRPPEAWVFIEHQLSPAYGVTGGFLGCRIHALAALLSL